MEHTITVSPVQTGTKHGGEVTRHHATCSCGWSQLLANGSKRRAVADGETHLQEQ